MVAASAANAADVVGGIAQAAAGVSRMRRRRRVPARRPKPVQNLAMRLCGLVMYISCPSNTLINRYSTTPVILLMPQNRRLAVTARLQFCKPCIAKYLKRRCTLMRHIVGKSLAIHYFLVDVVIRADIKIRKIIAIGFGMQNIDSHLWPE
jgi:hypothetical protein